MAKRKRPTKRLVRCNVCGASQARIRRVSRTYGSGKHLLVIENIPVVSCPVCGESYLTAETLHELERLKLHGKALAVGRQVGVVSFAASRDGS